MGIPTVEIISGPTPVFTVTDELYDEINQGVPAEELDLIARIILSVSASFIDKANAVLDALREGDRALFKFPDPATGAQTMRASVVDLALLYRYEDETGNTTYLETDSEFNCVKLTCWLDPETALILFDHQKLLGLNTQLPDDDQNDGDEYDW